MVNFNAETYKIRKKEWNNELKQLHDNNYEKIVKDNAGKYSRYKNILGTNDNMMELIRSKVPIAEKCFNLCSIHDKQCVGASYLRYKDVEKGTICALYGNTRPLQLIDDVNKYIKFKQPNSDTNFLDDVDVDTFIKKTYDPKQTSDYLEYPNTNYAAEVNGGYRVDNTMCSINKSVNNCETDCNNNSKCIGIYHNPNLRDLRRKNRCCTKYDRANRQTIVPENGGVLKLKKYYDRSKYTKIDRFE
jgi:hypothetical protein